MKHQSTYKRYSAITFVASLLALLAACAVPEVDVAKSWKDPTIPDIDAGNFQLPAEYRREGMISSSTYQVYVLVLADTKLEAEEKGVLMCHEKAYQMLLKEPFIFRSLSEYGRKTIFAMIKEKGRVVRMERESSKTWSIAMQIRKIGMKEYLERIY